nr:glycosyltransferase [Allorhizobium sonneratiae]
MLRHYTFDSSESAKSANILDKNTDTTKKISVVVPCYNVEKYITDTCNSILANSVHVDIEVIIVDDGSTDRSAEIAQEILTKGGVPTTIVRIPNSGLAAARNVGLHFASAPYIAFLDADDLMAPDAYFHLYRLGSTENCDQVFARSSAFDDERYNDFEFFDTEVWNTILSGLTERAFNPLSEPYVFSTEPKTCARIWRREFLIENKLYFPEGKIFEDIGLHIRSLAISKKIGIVDVQGLLYRVGRTGALTLDRSKKRLDVISNIHESLITPDVQGLTNEAGAFALLGFMRIARWCRGMIDLRMKKEFDIALAQCFQHVPSKWVDALYRVNPREADKFLTVKTKGQPIGVAIHSAGTWLSRRLHKKRVSGMPGWKNLGTDTPAATTSAHRRFHFSEIRSFGPALAMLPLNSRIAFLSSHSRISALRIARTRPFTTIYVMDEGSDAITSELKQQKNIFIFKELSDLLKEVTAQQNHLDMIDLGDNATDELLQKLQSIEADFIVGAFDPLSVHNTANFLASVRSKVSRGYFLWRFDGQRFTYSRSSAGPAVSVIVPVYNILPYLDQCIESLSNQTLRDREIILVDDGASDGSALRCDEWAQKDPTIKVIHKPNGGCASARMSGLEAASGEFVTFIDGDDWVDTTMLERLFGLSLQTGDDIVEGGWCFAFPSGATDDRTTVERQQCYLGKGGIMRRPKDLALIDQPTIWRRLYKRAFLNKQKIGFDIRLRRFDDMPFQFETLFRSPDIAYDDHCMTYYRQGREGQDIGATDEKLYVHFPIMNMLRETALNSGSKDVFKKFLIIQYHTHAWALSKIKPELKDTYKAYMSRDMFGPEQYGGALTNLNRLLRIFPRNRIRILRIYFQYITSAKNMSLPQIHEVK